MDTNITQRKTLFKLGTVVATPGFMRLCSEAGQDVKDIAFGMLLRHVSGDFGNMDEYDCGANMRSIQGVRVGTVQSEYDFGTDKVWVITEADRKTTTFLLPSEY